MQGDTFLIILLFVIIGLVILFLYFYNQDNDDANNKPKSKRPRTNYIPPGATTKTISYGNKTTAGCDTDMLSSKFDKRNKNLITQSDSESTVSLGTIADNYGSSSMINQCHKAKQQWLEHLDRHQQEKRDSMGEKLTRRALEQLYGKKFDKIRPDWFKNPKTGRPLELDGYCPELKMAFEYHGVQHREFPNGFHKTEQEFYDQVARDIYKAQRCEKLGIYLIITDYKIAHNDIFEEVKKLTPEYRIKHEK